jgi:hypothetical protein
VTDLIDIDVLERRARTCQESGAGLIEPSAVLELIGRLRAAETLLGRREAAKVETSLGLAEDACSCDESLALKARVRELEALLADAELRAATEAKPDA